MSRSLTSVIAGVPVSGAPGGRITSTNPARTGAVIAEVALGDAGTYAAAAREARKAQPAWADVPAPIRGRAIAHIGRVVEANAESLARLVTREIGKPYAEALGEVREIVDTCDFFLGEGRRLYGQTVPSNAEITTVQPRRMRSIVVRAMPVTALRRCLLCPDATARRIMSSRLATTAPYRAASQFSRSQFVRSCTASTAACRMRSWSLSSISQP
jgi:hypothetical protein